MSKVQYKEIKGKRTVFGKFIKIVFILFNLLMLYWMIAGMGAATNHVDELSNNAEKAGAAIGTGLGAMMILFIWGIGDVILGMFVLFTRPSRTLVAEETK